MLTILTDVISAVGIWDTLTSAAAALIKERNYPASSIRLKVRMWMITNVRNQNHGNLHNFSDLLVKKRSLHGRRSQLFRYVHVITMRFMNCSPVGTYNTVCSEANVAHDCEMILFTRGCTER